MRTSTRRPTIRDVAREAGVSKSLVSLVYSSPRSVSDKRKEKVLAAAKKLGYAPNFLARSLAADAGTFIAILVADLHNPLFPEIADLVRVKLEKEGRQYFITSAMIKNDSGIPFLDKQTLNSILDLRPESLLVIGSIPRIEILDNLPKELPIVIASGVPSGIPRAISVRTNEELAMELVVNHLVELGHQNIAHIAGVSNVVGKDRAQGYAKAMRLQGLENFINIFQAKSDDESGGYEIARQILNLKNHPTAISCFNDLQAIGAQTAIIDAKAKVSLVGYDNTYLSGLRQVNLTSVDPGNKEIAEVCANLLLDEKFSPNETYQSLPNLVIRKSSIKLVKENR